MNDWYNDRSLSLWNTDKRLKEFFQEYESYANANTHTTLKTRDLISALQAKGHLQTARGNLAAAFTRFRDRGFIREDNSLGEPARFFAEDKLELGELIIDLMAKRPATKENSPNVKPFVIICRVFNAMLQMEIDPDDIFLTYAECKEYLFPCNDYSSINFDLVEKILRERRYGVDGKVIERVALNHNEGTNFGVWFNGLRDSAVFLPLIDGSLSRTLKPNRKQKEFFRFVSENAESFVETPTSSKIKLYDYYCDGKTGLLEVIADVIKPNAPSLKGDDVKILFEYLFGYKKRKGFEYLKFFKNDCFGVYFPFIALPRIPIRKIYYTNKPIGDALFEYANNSGHYYKMLENDEVEFQRIKKQSEERFMLIERTPRTESDKKHPLNQILYGVPGTSKTYSTVEYALAILEGREIDFRLQTVSERKAAMIKYNKAIAEGKIRLIAFHHTYGYTEFMKVLGGIAQLAMNDKVGKYVLIIDEINRGNPQKIFGDLLTLIEDDKRWGEANAIQAVLSSGESFAVPNNLYIVGTMSTADKSLALIDSVLRRRFKFIEHKPQYELIDDEDLRAVMQRLNDSLTKSLENTDFLIGHAYFMNKTMGHLIDIMNDSIVPLLYEYFYGDSKKILMTLKETLKDTGCKPEQSASGRISVV